jgi:GNAT superfamily N-acetyltransferase
MEEFRLSKVSYSKCAKELLDFRNLNRSARRDDVYFAWRYAQRPSGIEPSIVWAHDSASRPVGSLSLVPHHYDVSGESHMIGVLGDISVSERMRGKGIAFKMLEHLWTLSEVRKLRACMVLPNEEASRPLSKSGWVEVSGLERYVRLSNIEGHARRKLKSAFLAKAISAPVRAMLSVTDALNRVPEGFNAGLAEGFDERFTGLWEKMNKDGIVVGNRDSRYLSWRYASHPLNKYNIFIMEDGGTLTGYAVYRFEEDQLHIDDILAEERTCPFIIPCLLKFIKSNALSTILIRLGENCRLDFGLFKNGFLKRKDRQKLMIRASDPGNPVWLNWYLTAGDKDV